MKKQDIKALAKLVSLFPVEVQDILLGEIYHGDAHVGLSASNVLKPIFGINTDLKARLANAERARRDFQEDMQSYLAPACSAASGILGFIASRMAASATTSIVPVIRQIASVGLFVYGIASGVSRYMDNAEVAEKAEEARAKLEELAPLVTILDGLFMRMETKRPSSKTVLFLTDLLSERLGQVEEIITLIDASSVIDGSFLKKLKVIKNG